MLALIVCTNFHKINFCSCHRLRKYFYNENFQIYGNYYVSIDACSEVKPVVYLTKVSQGQLTFNWSRLNSECSTVQYLIISDCGSCPRSINDETSATCSNLQLLETERNCTFSVMSMTRGFNGTSSDPFTVTLKGIIIIL